jgi:hypothetical protein
MILYKRPKFNKKNMNGENPEMSQKIADQEANTEKLKVVKSSTVEVNLDKSAEQMAEAQTEIARINETLDSHDKSILKLSDALENMDIDNDTREKIAEELKWINDKTVELINSRLGKKRLIEQVSKGSKAGGLDVENTGVIEVLREKTGEIKLPAFEKTPPKLSKQARTETQVMRVRNKERKLPELPANALTSIEDTPEDLPANAITPNVGMPEAKNAHLTEAPANDAENFDLYGSLTAGEADHRANIDNLVRQKEAQADAKALASPEAKISAAREKGDLRRAKQKAEVDKQSNAIASIVEARRKKNEKLTGKSEAA